ncbi:MAG TPA: hypothetical protein VHB18_06635 [Mycobacteriales bacterium]|jgi:hypothetical protein|nr:hypothetical protein [Mycobacteriales bacterium]
MNKARRLGTTITCVALAATTACSSSGSTGTSRTDRQRAAVTYAQQLADSAPRIAGERPFTGTPPKDLRHVDETIGVSNLVVRARYWTAPGSLRHVYESLSNATPAGFRLTGYGDPTSQAEDVAGRGFLHFDPVSPPPYIDATELYVELEAGTGGRTIIAAFGEAAAHPIRTAAETIPVADSKVTILRRHLGRPGGIVRTVRLDAAHSAAFVRAFNASPVRAPGVCVGGIGPALGYQITIVSGGRTWQISYPGGANCGGFGVLLGKESLPDLEVPDAMRRLINDDYLGGKAYIDGSLGAVGGPDRSGLRPFRHGTVMAMSKGRVVAQASVVGQLGRFELEVPPGRYTLIGHSPNYESGRGVCNGYRPVTVEPNRSTAVNVLCQER